MAQIIKHRRGSLEALSAVTGSLQKGEIIIASGSSNITASNGNAITFVVPADGQVQATNRIIRGTTAPNVFPANIYNGMLNGVPFYASASGVLPTLYLLGGGSNEAIDLVGNIQPFSSSVAVSINALSASIGSGTIGTSVTLLNTFSGSVLTQLSTIGTTTASFETRNASLATITGSLINSASANRVSITNLNSATASLFIDTNNLETFSASANTRFTEIGVVSGSLIASASAAKTTNDSQGVSITNINTFSGSQLTQNTALATITGSLITSASNAVVSITNLNGATGSYAKLTGGNSFTGQQTITGSLWITQDLIVQGSSSIQNISASNVYIGDNIITLNANSPAIRFAGFEVYDSGSTGASGSLLWDSQNNRWLYAQPSGSGAPYNSAILINGPQNSGSLGSEQGLTANYIVKAQAGDHIMNSQIQDDGTTISIAGNLDLTGSMKSTQLNAIGTITGSLILSASADRVSITNINTLTSSALVRFTNLETTSASVNTSIANLNSFTSSNNSTTLLNSFTASAETRLTTIGNVTASFETRATSLATITGSLIASASALTIDTANLETFSSSVLTQLGTLATYTASVNTRLTEVGVVTGSLISSQSVDAARFSTLATYTGSVETRFSTLATLTGSNGVRLTNLETTSASLETRAGTIATLTGSYNTRLTEIGVVSGSLITSASSQNSRITVLEGTGTKQGVGTTNDVTFNSVTTTANVTIGGDLVVQGNTVTLNTATLVVEDKLISLASGSTTAAASNGAGIEVLGASATITYQSTPDAWQFNKPITGSAVTASLNVPSGGGNSKRIAFRDTNDNINFVTAPTTAGDLLQYDGSNFVMSNTIDGGSF